MSISIGNGLMDWLLGRNSYTVDINRDQGYARISIDLSTERTDEEIQVGLGQRLDILKFTGNNGTVSFKINNRKANMLFPEEIKSIVLLTSSIFLTNTAQPGNELVILVSSSPFGLAVTRNVALSSAGGDLAAQTTLESVDSRLSDVVTSIEEIKDNTWYIHGSTSSIASWTNFQSDEGGIYTGTITMTDDNTAQMTTQVGLMTVLYIQCADNPLYIGNSSNQYYRLATNDSIRFDFTWPRVLYVRNANPGNNGKINWIGKMSVT